MIAAGLFLGYRIMNRQSRFNAENGKPGDPGLESTAEGMAVDSRGNLYAATQLGVQVFTSA